MAYVLVGPHMLWPMHVMAHLCRARWSSISTSDREVEKLITMGMRASLPYWANLLDLKDQVVTFWPMIIKSGAMNDALIGSLLLTASLGLSAADRWFLKGWSTGIVVILFHEWEKYGKTLKVQNRILVSKYNCFIAISSGRFGLDWWIEIWSRLFSVSKL